MKIDMNTTEKISMYVYLVFNNGRMEDLSGARRKIVQILDDGSDQIFDSHPIGTFFVLFPLENIPRKRVTTLKYTLSQGHGINFIPD